MLGSFAAAGGHLLPVVRHDADALGLALGARGGLCLALVMRAQQVGVAVPVVRVHEHEVAVVQVRGHPLALRLANGNKSRTAELLSIWPTLVDAKLVDNEVRVVIEEI